MFSGTPTSTTSNNNVGAVNIDSILFGNNGSAGQTAAFTIGSGTQSPTPSLTLLNGATITTTASVSGTLQDTISSNVTMSGSNVFNLGANHILKLTGTISGAGTLVKQGSADLNIGSAAVITGSFTGMTIDSGTVTLVGAEKFAAINGLTVNIGGSTAATLQLNSGSSSGVTGTSTSNFQMGNDATIQVTNNASGNQRFTAADFNVANAAVTTAKTLTFTGGGSGNLQTVAVDGVIRDNSTSGIVNVAFTGANDYVLAGNSTYSGSTSVVTNVLVNGTLASPIVTVNSTGFLGGSGRIGGGVSVLSGGTLAPGGTATGSTLTNTIATLTVGSLDLRTGSRTNLSVTGTTPGILFDQVAFAGGSPSLTYGGLLNLTLSGSYADDTSFQLFSGFTSQSGNLSSISLDATGSPYAGLTFQLYNSFSTVEKSFLTDTFGVQAGDWITGWNSDQQRMVFSQSTGTLTIVPEPSTIVFAGIGMAMFGWSTWTRRRAWARRQAIEAATA